MRSVAPLLMFLPCIRLLQQMPCMFIAERVAFGGNTRCSSEKGNGTKESARALYQEACIK